MAAPQDLVNLSRCGLAKGALLLAAASFAIGLQSGPVRADSDAMIGGFIGGIIGGAIASEANKSGKRRTSSGKKAPKASGISTAQREANREVQTALNSFGFPVGTPDGALGPNSRAAIGQYQVFMGYPATGQLTDLERMVLVGAWQKSMIGGTAIAGVVASHPQGVRGLLLNERDMLAGGSGALIGGTALAGLPPEISSVVFEIAQNAGVQPQQLVQKSGFVQLADLNADGRTDYLLDTSATGSAFWCSEMSCAVRVFVSTPEGYRRNDFQALNVTPAMFSCVAGSCVKNDTPTTFAAAPEATMPPGAGLEGNLVSTNAESGQQASAVGTAQVQPSLPAFSMTQPAMQIQSAAAHCANVSIVTSSAGGFVAISDLTDPMQALGEQFCLARGYAINEGQDLATKVVGASAQQIETQCQSLVPAMASHIAVLGQTTAGDMLTRVQGFVAGAGQSPAQLTDMARICLSVAYRTDNAELALDSALLMVGAGATPYAELIGSHLLMGFGVPSDQQMATDWYRMSVSAMQSGMPAVFSPAQPERSALIEKAVSMLSGQISASQTQPASSKGTTLPSFGLVAQP